MIMKGLCHYHTVLGPLQSVMQDLHSDDNDEDSDDDDDNDMDSDVERPAHTHLTHHQRRLVSPRMDLRLRQVILMGYRGCRVVGEQVCDFSVSHLNGVLFETLSRAAW